MQTTRIIRRILRNLLYLRAYIILYGGKNMSGVLRHWQMPEWSARALWDFAYSVLSKTYEYNPSADDWRLIRPEDIPGGTAGLWLNPVATAAVYTTMCPGGVIFRVPQGQGFGFYGFWIQGEDLGLGAGYRLRINDVTRIECPIHEFMSDSKGANKLLNSSATVSYTHLTLPTICSV